MSAPQHLGQLSAGEWQQFQEIGDRFHQAWAEGGPPDLATFLPPADSPLRAVVLHELITIDLEMRWRRGQPMGLEVYLDRYPELGGARSLPPALVFQEYHVRHRFGDRPALATYQQRFADQFEELGKMAMQETNAPPSTTTPRTPPAVPPPPAPPALPPDPAAKAPAKTDDNVLNVIGGYKLRQRIGSAAFGEVWSAEAPGGVPVAIKMLFRPVDAEEAQRELTALELVRGLHHHCLVQLHSFWSTQERTYIVMELAECSLRDRLDACREAGLQGIPHDELFVYFRDAAEGLDFLHANHVTHRDIKPENILLVHGHAKLADFGLAREQGSRVLSTATGAGTPLYMAPEVFRGQVSPHSDQYSLAMAYAELRLDRRLLTGVNLVELMLEHLECTPDLAPLPEAEQRVILKGLSKDPTQRYPSCLAWIEALERVRDKAGQPDQPAPPAAQEKDSKPAPRTSDTLNGGPYQTLRPGALPTPRRTGEHSRRAILRQTPDAVPQPPRRRRRRLVALLALLLLVVGGVGAAVAYEWPRIRAAVHAVGPVAQVDSRPPGGTEPDVVPSVPDKPTTPVPVSAPPKDTPPAVQETSPPPKQPAAAVKDPPPPAVADTKPPPEPVPPAPKPPEPVPPTPVPVTPPPKPPEPASLTLESPADLTLGTGQQAKVHLGIGRRNYKGPVELTFVGLPAGVTTPELAPVSPDAESADITVAVGAAAVTSATSTVTVRVEGGGAQNQATFKLTVLWLPPKFQPAGPATQADLGGRGKTYFKRIRREFPGAPAAEFVLVPKARTDDPDTFYMMVDKASVGLFRQYLEKTKAKARAGWNDTADAAVPVFDVAVEDAQHFAHWLGGNLPSPAQWDKAAGFRDQAGREGPFQGKWGDSRKPQIAVGRTGPLKVGEAKDDVSVFGCRDMAGNGWEWTNSVEPGDRRVPLERARAGDTVRLRGQTYDAKGPLLFEEMEKPGQPVFRQCPYNLTLPWLGFRVVFQPK